MSKGAIGFDIKGAKSMFFDRKAVMRVMDRKSRKALSRYGALVRTVAKRSIKKARQKKISELTPAEAEKYKRAKSAGKRKGFKVRRPLASSRPGEPHRERTGLIKKFIFFVYDQQVKSVNIGPARLSKRGDAPHVLEHGGTANRGGTKIKIEARPTMQLADAKSRGKLEQFFKDATR